MPFEFFVYLYCSCLKNLSFSSPYQYDFKLSLNCVLVFTTVMVEVQESIPAFSFELKLILVHMINIQNRLEFSSFQAIYEDHFLIIMFRLGGM